MGSTGPNEQRILVVGATTFRNNGKWGADWSANRGASTDPWLSLSHRVRYLSINTRNDRGTSDILRKDKSWECLDTKRISWWAITRATHQMSLSLRGKKTLGDRILNWNPDLSESSEVDGPSSFISIIRNLVFINSKLNEKLLIWRT